MQQINEEYPLIVLGGGPAGLAAMHTALQHKIPVKLFEKETEAGGLCRTLKYKGFRFDMGGHRFFSKSRRVTQFWAETLGDDFLKRPRKSSIFFQGRYIDYPLKPLNALRSLGVCESCKSIVSFCIRNLKKEDIHLNLETWLTHQFGKKLYQFFFKSYTEKVWGIPCSQIDAGWGAQRIKGLNLIKAISSALLPSRAKGITTLIDHFYYPKFGPGQMYTTLAKKCLAAGGKINLQEEVTGFGINNHKISSIQTRTPAGATTIHRCGAVISSLPFSDLVLQLGAFSPAAKNAGKKLSYRALITVNLLLKKNIHRKENWIYIHDSDYRAGRIQFFKNWSKYLVPDAEQSSLGMEYFACEDDELWQMSDAELLGLATREAVALGLLEGTDIYDGMVMRISKAYPLLQVGYAKNVELIRQELEAINNLQVIGRAGMFKYNNMDHSILTGMLAVENLTGKNHDLWQVNADNDYLEEITVPEKEMI